MRSNWTGALSVSLVNLPIKLGSTTKNNSLDLHMVRKADGSRIKFLRVAEADVSQSGPLKEVPWNDITKSYEAADGSLVILNKDELATPTNKVAEVETFTDEMNIPPMSAKNTYWVQPDLGGDKVYALLATALQETGKVAVLKFAMRDRESQAVLRARDGYLTLEVLEWDADLIRPDFPAPADTASEQDHQLVKRMIEDMTTKYDHTAQTDTYAEHVMEIVNSKIDAGDFIKPPATVTKGRMPVDLTAALQASVDAQKAKATVPAPRTRKKAAA